MGLARGEPVRNMNAFCLHDYDGLVGQKGFQDGPYVHLPKEEFIMEDCIFCKIIAGEIPSTKVWEDDNFFAFKDINPVAPVHVLVIPKKHIQSIADLTPDDAAVAGKMLYAIQKVAQVMNLDKDGFRVVFNTGEKAGQTVHHMHAHILGGKEMAWPGV